MVALKSHFSFLLWSFAAIAVLFALDGSWPVAAQDDSSSSKSAPSHSTASSGSHRTAKTSASRHSTTSRTTTTSHHFHHHEAAEAVTPTRHARGKRSHGQPETAQAPAPDSVKHGRHHHAAQSTASAPEPDQKREATTVITDKHGKRHEVVAEVTVDRHGRRHKHYHEVAQETVVRDKHGHIIKRFFREVAHGHSRALQGEEAVAGAPKKEQEEVVQREPEELPHEYGSYSKVYALYDEATNARLAGNYKSAIASLSKALDMVPANAHGGPSLLSLNMEFELAQAAEASGNFGLSARYFARAVADRPNFTEAFVRLASVLARNGQSGEALRAARSAVEHNPNDPRAHTILSVMLGRNGLSADAKAEKIRAQNLMGSNTRIDPVPAEPPANATTSPANQSDANDGQNSNPSTYPSNNPLSNPAGNLETGPASSPANSSIPSSAPEPGASANN
jgi:Tetratricopeptide repeat